MVKVRPGHVGIEATRKKDMLEEAEADEKIGGYVNVQDRIGRT